jgi:hypothetical protein
MIAAATEAKPWIVVVGGFLGSGKTTLLISAAKELMSRGMRSAIIFNDQGGTLVDTQHARLNGIQNGEVSGGCFCCRYSDLISVVDSLRQHSPDVIFAEPVGSCADISATILHPLLEFTDRYRIAPYTVLVDPDRALSLVRKDANRNLRYLFWKQLGEADLVCLTKSDLHRECPDIGIRTLRRISAKTKQGVSEWLEEVLSGKVPPGSKVLDIDYEEYAAAEAALAWLNLQVTIKPDVPLSPAMILGPLLDRLDNSLANNRLSIVHLKAIMSSESGFIKAAICSNGEEPVIEGRLDASPSATHQLSLNLRAVGEAAQVAEITLKAVQQTNIRLAGLEITCFHPSAPKPERRVWSPEGSCSLLSK